MFLHELTYLAVFTECLLCAKNCSGHFWDQLIKQTKIAAVIALLFSEDEQVISINNKHILVITKIRCMDWKVIRTVGKISTMGKR